MLKIHHTLSVLLKKTILSNPVTTVNLRRTVSSRLFKQVTISQKRPIFSIPLKHTVQKQWHSSTELIPSVRSTLPVYAEKYNTTERVLGIFKEVLTTNRQEVKTSNLKSYKTSQNIIQYSPFSSSNISKINSTSKKLELIRSEKSSPVRTQSYMVTSKTLSIIPHNIPTKITSNFSLDILYPEKTTLVITKLVKLGESMRLFPNISYTEGTTFSNLHLRIQSQLYQNNQSKSIPSKDLSSLKSYYTTVKISLSKQEPYSTTTMDSSFIFKKYLLGLLQTFRSIESTSKAPKAYQATPTWWELLKLNVSKSLETLVKPGEKFVTVALDQTKSVDDLFKSLSFMTEINQTTEQRDGSKVKIYEMLSKSTKRKLFSGEQIMITTQVILQYTLFEKVKTHVKYQLTPKYFYTFLTPSFLSDQITTPITREKLHKSHFIPTVWFIEKSTSQSVFLSIGSPKIPLLMSTTHILDQQFWDKISRRVTEKISTKKARQLIKEFTLSDVSQSSDKGFTSGDTDLLYINASKKLLSPGSVHIKYVLGGNVGQDVGLNYNLNTYEIFVPWLDITEPMVPLNESLITAKHERSTSVERLRQITKSDDESKQIGLKSKTIHDDPNLILALSGAEFDKKSLNDDRKLIFHKPILPAYSLPEETATPILFQSNVQYFDQEVTFIDLTYTYDKEIYEARETGSLKEMSVPFTTFQERISIMPPESRDYIDSGVDTIELEFITQQRMLKYKTEVEDKRGFEILKIPRISEEKSSDLFSSTTITFERTLTLQTRNLSTRSLKYVRTGRLTEIIIQHKDVTEATISRNTTHVLLEELHSYSFATTISLFRSNITAVAKKVVTAPQIHIGGSISASYVIFDRDNIVVSQVYTSGSIFSEDFIVTRDEVLQAHSDQSFVVRDITISQIHIKVSTTNKNTVDTRETVTVPQIHIDSILGPVSVVTWKTVTDSQIHIDDSIFTKDIVTRDMITSQQIHTNGSTVSKTIVVASNVSKVPQIHTVDSFIFKDSFPRDIASVSSKGIDESSITKYLHIDLQLGRTKPEIALDFGTTLKYDSNDSVFVTDASAFPKILERLAINVTLLEKDADTMVVRDFVTATQLLRNGSIITKDLVIDGYVSITTKKVITVQVDLNGSFITKAAYTVPNIDISRLDIPMDEATPTRITSDGYIVAPNITSVQQINIDGMIIVKDFVTIPQIDLAGTSVIVTVLKPEKSFNIMDAVTVLLSNTEGLSTTADAVVKIGQDELAVAIHTVQYPQVDVYTSFLTRIPVIFKQTDMAVTKSGRVKNEFLVARYNVSDPQIYGSDIVSDAVVTSSVSHRYFGGSTLVQDSVTPAEIDMYKSFVTKVSYSMHTDQLEDAVDVDESDVTKDTVTIPYITRDKSSIDRYISVVWYPVIMISKDGVTVPHIAGSVQQSTSLPTRGPAFILEVVSGRSFDPRYAVKVPPVDTDGPISFRDFITVSQVVIEESTSVPMGTSVVLPSNTTKSVITTILIKVTEKDASTNTKITVKIPQIDKEEPVFGKDAVDDVREIISVLQTDVTVKSAVIMSAVTVPQVDRDGLVITNEKTGTDPQGYITAMKPLTYFQSPLTFQKQKTITIYLPWHKTFTSKFITEQSTTQTRRDDIWWKRTQILADNGTDKRITATVMRIMDIQTLETSLQLGTIKTLMFRVGKDFLNDLSTFTTERESWKLTWRYNVTMLLDIVVSYPTFFSTVSPTLLISSTNIKTDIDKSKPTVIPIQSTNPTKLFGTTMNEIIQLTAKELSEVDTVTSLTILNEMISSTLTENIFAFSETSVTTTETTDPFYSMLEMSGYEMLHKKKLSEHFKQMSQLTNRDMEILTPMSLLAPGYHSADHLSSDFSSTQQRYLTSIVISPIEEYFRKTPETTQLSKAFFTRKEKHVSHTDFVSSFWMPSVTIETIKPRKFDGVHKIKSKMIDITTFNTIDITHGRLQGNKSRYSEGLILSTYTSQSVSQHSEGLVLFIGKHDNVSGFTERLVPTVSSFDVNRYLHRLVPSKSSPQNELISSLSLEISNITKFSISTAEKKHKLDSTELYEEHGLEGTTDVTFILENTLLFLPFASPPVLSEFMSETLTSETSTDVEDTVSSSLPKGTSTETLWKPDAFQKTSDKPKYDKEDKITPRTLHTENQSKIYFPFLKLLSQETSFKTKTFSEVQSSPLYQKIKFELQSEPYMHDFSTKFDKYRRSLISQQRVKPSTDIMQSKPIKWLDVTTDGITKSLIRSEMKAMLDHTKPTRRYFKKRDISETFYPYQTSTPGRFIDIIDFYDNDTVKQLKVIGYVTKEHGVIIKNASFLHTITPKISSHKENISSSSLLTLPSYESTYRELEFSKHGRSDLGKIFTGQSKMPQNVSKPIRDFATSKLFELFETKLGTWQPLLVTQTPLISVFKSQYQLKEYTKRKILYSLTTLARSTNMTKTTASKDETCVSFKKERGEVTPASSIYILINGSSAMEAKTKKPIATKEPMTRTTSRKMSSEITLSIRTNISHLSTQHTKTIQDKITFDLLEKLHTTLFTLAVVSNSTSKGSFIITSASNDMQSLLATPETIYQTSFEMFLFNIASNESKVFTTMIPKIRHNMFQLNVLNTTMLTTAQKISQVSKLLHIIKQAVITNATFELVDVSSTVFPNITSITASEVKLSATTDRVIHVEELTITVQQMYDATTELSEMALVVLRTSEYFDSLLATSTSALFDRSLDVFKMKNESNLKQFLQLSTSNQLNIHMKGTMETFHTDVIETTKSQRKGTELPMSEIQKKISEITTRILPTEVSEKIDTALLDVAVLQGTAKTQMAVTIRFEILHIDSDHNISALVLENKNISEAVLLPFKENSTLAKQPFITVDIWFNNKTINELQYDQTENYWVAWIQQSLTPKVPIKFMTEGKIQITTHDHFTQTWKLSEPVKQTSDEAITTRIPLTKTTSREIPMKSKSQESLKETTGSMFLFSRAPESSLAPQLTSEMESKVKKATKSRIEVERKSLDRKTISKTEISLIYITESITVSTVEQKQILPKPLIKMNESSTVIIKGEENTYSTGNVSNMLHVTKPSVVMFKTIKTKALADIDVYRTELTTVESKFMPKFLPFYHEGDITTPKILIITTISKSVVPSQSKKVAEPSLSIIQVTFETSSYDSMSQTKSPLVYLNKSIQTITTYLGIDIRKTLINTQINEFVWPSTSKVILDSQIFRTPLTEIVTETTETSKMLIVSNTTHLLTKAIPEFLLKHNTEIKTTYLIGDSVNITELPTKFMWNVLLYNTGSPKMIQSHRPRHIYQMSNTSNETLILVPTVANERFIRKSLDFVQNTSLSFHISESFTLESITKKSVTESTIVAQKKSLKTTLDLADKSITTERVIFSITMHITPDISLISVTSVMKPLSSQYVLEKSFVSKYRWEQSYIYKVDKTTFHLQYFQPFTNISSKLTLLSTPKMEYDSSPQLNLSDVKIQITTLPFIPTQKTLTPYIDYDTKLFNSTFLLQPIKTKIKIDLKHLFSNRTSMTDLVSLVPSKMSILNTSIDSWQKGISMTVMPKLNFSSLVSPKTYFKQVTKRMRRIPYVSVTTVTNRTSSEQMASVLEMQTPMKIWTLREVTRQWQRTASFSEMYGLNLYLYTTKVSQTSLHGFSVSLTPLKLFPITSLSNTPLPTIITLSPVTATASYIVTFELKLKQREKTSSLPIIQSTTDVTFYNQPISKTEKTLTSVKPTYSESYDIVSYFSNVKLIPFFYVGDIMSTNMLSIQLSNRTDSRLPKLNFTSDKETTSTTMEFIETIIDPSDEKVLKISSSTPIKLIISRQTFLTNPSQLSITPITDSSFYYRSFQPSTITSLHQITMTTDFMNASITAFSHWTNEQKLGKAFISAYMYKLEEKSTSKSLHFVFPVGKEVTTVLSGFSFDDRLINKTNNISHIKYLFSKPEIVDNNLLYTPSFQKLLENRTLLVTVMQEISVVSQPRVFSPQETSKGFLFAVSSSQNLSESTKLFTKPQILETPEDILLTATSFQQVSEGISIQMRSSFIETSEDILFTTDLSQGISERTSLLVETPSQKMDKDILVTIYPIQTILEEKTIYHETRHLLQTHQLSFDVTTKQVLEENLDSISSKPYSYGKYVMPAWMHFTTTSAWKLGEVSKLKNQTDKPVTSDLFRVTRSYFIKEEQSITDDTETEWYKLLEVSTLKLIYKLPKTKKTTQLLISFIAYSNTYFDSMITFITTQTTVSSKVFSSIEESELKIKSVSHHTVTQSFQKFDYGLISKDHRHKVNTIFILDYYDFSTSQYFTTDSSDTLPFKTVQYFKESSSEVSFLPHLLYNITSLLSRYPNQTSVSLSFAQLIKSTDSTFVFSQTSKIKVIGSTTETNASQISKLPFSTLVSSKPSAITTESTSNYLLIKPIFSVEPKYPNLTIKYETSRNVSETFADINERSILTTDVQFLTFPETKVVKRTSTDYVIWSLDDTSEKVTHYTYKEITSFHKTGKTFYILDKIYSESLLQTSSEVIGYILVTSQAFQESSLFRESFQREIKFTQKSDFITQVQLESISATVPFSHKDYFALLPSGSRAKTSTEEIYTYRLNLEDTSISKRPQQLLSTKIKTSKLPLSSFTIMLDAFKDKRDHTISPHIFMSTLPLAVTLDYSKDDAFAKLKRLSQVPSLSNITKLIVTILSPKGRQGFLSELDKISISTGSEQTTVVAEIEVDYETHEKNVSIYQKDSEIFTFTSKIKTRVVNESSIKSDILTESTPRSIIRHSLEHKLALEEIPSYTTIQNVTDIITVLQVTGIVTQFEISTLATTFYRPEVAFEFSISSQYPDLQEDISTYVPSLVVAISTENILVTSKMKPLIYLNESDTKYFSKHISFKPKAQVISTELSFTMIIKNTTGDMTITKRAKKISKKFSELEPTLRTVIPADMIYTNQTNLTIPESTTTDLEFSLETFAVAKDIIKSTTKKDIDMLDIITTLAFINQISEETISEKPAISVSNIAFLKEIITSRAYEDNVTGIEYIWQFGIRYFTSLPYSKTDYFNITYTQEKMSGLYITTTTTTTPVFIIKNISISKYYIQQEESFLTTTIKLPILMKSHDEETEKSSKDISEMQTTLSDSRILIDAPAGSLYIDADVYTTEVISKPITHGYMYMTHNISSSVLTKLDVIPHLSKRVSMLITNFYDDIHQQSIQNSNVTSKKKIIEESSKIMPKQSARQTGFYSTVFSKKFSTLIFSSYHFDIVTTTSIKRKYFVGYTVSPFKLDDSYSTVKSSHFLLWKDVQATVRLAISNITANTSDTSSENAEIIIHGLRSGTIFPLEKLTKKPVFYTSYKNDSQLSKIVDTMLQDTITEIITPSIILRKIYTEILSFKKQITGSPLIYFYRQDVDSYDQIISTHEVIIDRFQTKFATPKTEPQLSLVAIKSTCCDLYEVIYPKSKDVTIPNISFNISFATLLFNQSIYMLGSYTAAIFDKVTIIPYSKDITETTENTWGIVHILHIPLTTDMVFGINITNVSDIGIYGSNDTIQTLQKPAEASIDIIDTTDNVVKYFKETEISKIIIARSQIKTDIRMKTTEADKMASSTESSEISMLYLKAKTKLISTFHTLKDSPGVSYKTSLEVISKKNDTETVTTTYFIVPHMEDKNYSNLMVLGMTPILESRIILKNKTEITLSSFPERLETSLFHSESPEISTDHFKSQEKFLFSTFEKKVIPVTHRTTTTRIHVDKLPLIETIFLSLQTVSIRKKYTVSIPVITSTRSFKKTSQKEHKKDGLSYPFKLKSETVKDTYTKVTDKTTTPNQTMEQIDIKDILHLNTEQNMFDSLLINTLLIPTLVIAKENTSSFQNQTQKDSGFHDPFMPFTTRETCKYTRKGLISTLHQAIVSRRQSYRSFLQSKTELYTLTTEFTPSVLQFTSKITEEEYFKEQRVITVPHTITTVSYTTTKLPHTTVNPYITFTAANIIHIESYTTTTSYTTVEIFHSTTTILQTPTPIPYTTATIPNDTSILPLGISILSNSTTDSTYTTAILQKHDSILSHILNETAYTATESINSTITPYIRTEIIEKTILILHNITVTPLNTTVAPYTITVTAHKITVTPLNTTVIPHDTATTHNITIVSHNTTVTPDYKAITPLNTTVTSLNTTVTPDNITVTPHNTTVTPHNTTVTHNITVIPHYITITLFNTTVTSHNTTVKPHNITITPHSIPVIPFNTTVTPHFITVTPLNITTAPQQTTTDNMLHILTADTYTVTKVQRSALHTTTVVMYILSSPHSTDDVLDALTIPQHTTSPTDTLYILNVTPYTMVKMLDASLYKSTTILDTTPALHQPVSVILHLSKVTLFNRTTLQTIIAYPESKTLYNTTVTSSTNITVQNTISSTQYRMSIALHTTNLTLHIGTEILNSTTTTSQPTQIERATTETLDATIVTSDSSATIISYDTMSVIPNTTNVTIFTKEVTLHKITAGSLKAIIKFLATGPVSFETTFVLSLEQTIVPDYFYDDQTNMLTTAKAESSSYISVLIYDSDIEKLRTVMWKGFTSISTAEMDYLVVSASDIMYTDKLETLIQNDITDKFTLTTYSHRKTNTTFKLATIKMTDSFDFKQQKDILITPSRKLGFVSPKQKTHLTVLQEQMTSNLTVAKKETEFYTSKLLYVTKFPSTQKEKEIPEKYREVKNGTKQETEFYVSGIFSTPFKRKKIEILSVTPTLKLPTSKHFMTSYFKPMFSKLQTFQTSSKQETEHSTTKFSITYISTIPSELNKTSLSASCYTNHSVTILTDELKRTLATKFQISSLPATKSAVFTALASDIVTDSFSLERKKSRTVKGQFQVIPTLQQNYTFTNYIFLKERITLPVLQSTEEEKRHSEARSSSFSKDLETFQLKSSFASARLEAITMKTSTAFETKYFTIYPEKGYGITSLLLKDLDGHSYIDKGYSMVIYNYTNWTDAMPLSKIIVISSNLVMTYTDKEKLIHPSFTFKEVTDLSQVEYKLTTNTIPSQEKQQMDELEFTLSSFHETLLNQSSAPMITSFNHSSFPVITKLFNHTLFTTFIYQSIIPISTFSFDYSIFLTPTLSYYHDTDSLTTISYNHSIVPTPVTFSYSVLPITSLHNYTIFSMTNMLFFHSTDSKIIVPYNYSTDLITTIPFNYSIDSKMMVKGIVDESRTSRSLIVEERTEYPTMRPTVTFRHHIERTNTDKVGRMKTSVDTSLISPKFTTEGKLTYDYSHITVTLPFAVETNESKVFYYKYKIEPCTKIHLLPKSDLFISQEKQKLNATSSVIFSEYLISTTNDSFIEHTSLTRRDKMSTDTTALHGLNIKCCRNEHIN
ncbi:Hypothetical predicted protein [Octopus vulgaris]|uniref:Uncharacterized protein n=1 Tax=Octopus vulgaris TaxID=6645 RepID=A0AA36AZK7_OCTVU|nr:Hypothetical predicted protein [Octopus vulgaris]